MSEGITSDVLLAQIAELRARLEVAEQERDRYRERALSHASSHRDYRALARNMQGAIADLRLRYAQADIRIANLTRQVADVITGLASGRIVVMRPPLAVTRPPER